MVALVLVLGTVSTIFATLVLTYISIATMVGPWIGPTIVLLSGVLLRVCTNLTHERYTATLTLVHAMSAGAGLVATGVGFAFPMFYFLEPTLFAQWLEKPFFFCSVLSAVTLCAGLLGLWIARVLGPLFFARQDCTFPVARVTYQALDAQQQPRQARFLGLGGAIAVVVCILKDGIAGIPAMLPAAVPLVPAAWMARISGLFFAPFSFSLALPVWPSMWAIGFIIGTSAALPLAVGIFMQWLMRGAVVSLPALSGMSFEACSVAFCSGLLASEFLLGSLLSWRTWRAIGKSAARFGHMIGHTMRTLSIASWSGTHVLSVDTTAALRWLPIALAPAVGFFWYFGMPLRTQLLFFALVAWAAYMIVLTGAQLGLVQFGRFSTLVLIPLMLCCGLDYVQATLVCVFFNVVAAVAADALFDERIAQLAGVSVRKTRLVQLFGLLVCAASIGLITWVLCTHLQLGSGAFFAQRGKAKALLLQAFGFDWRLVVLGALCGFGLKHLRISSTMVFSGIVMPTSISLGLIAGGVLSCFGKENTALVTLCAGVFATEALWILVRVILLPLF